MARQAELAAEEAERKRFEEEQLNAWVKREIEQAEFIAHDESKSQQERNAAIRKLRQWGTHSR